MEYSIDLIELARLIAQSRSFGDLCMQICVHLHKRGIDTKPFANAVEQNLKTELVTIKGEIVE